MSSQYTRDQAICMAFYVVYTDENMKIYKKKIEELDSFEICWTEVDIQEKRQLIELVTEGQAKQFINEVFSPKEHENEELYSKQTVSTAYVYEIVKQHTVFFGSRTAQSFATWCRNKKVDFLTSKEKKGKKISRDLFILDERCYGKK
ncbi:uncharacterized protein EV154DRAFT_476932 [Mucor mucedo]|uniref:uncharacterized protein n=1 Tax=Mucor mucedo TaxID=29922 RepID=UPI00221FA2F2|nr:uncharacterized protein EV154DRAFT_476932 [Mucor mucedo]KAI7895839.1 hypothetical protein EV154DRAFT_476932 [Mucor mucedo]